MHLEAFLVAILAFYGNILICPCLEGILAVIQMGLCTVRQRNIWWFHH